jgi:hypothetical protein
MSLIKDTLNAECLLEAAANYYEYKRIHDKARDEYTGYSWGYYGREYVKDKENAADEFQKLLTEFVTEIVASHLSTVDSDTAPSLNIK